MGFGLAAEAPLLQEFAAGAGDEVQLAHLDLEGVRQERGRVSLDSTSTDGDETVGLSELLALDGPLA